MWQNYFQNTKYINVLFGILSLNILSVSGLEYYTEKPDWYKSCKIYEPEFTKCSTESVQIMMNQIVSGAIPEIIEKFGPLDPIKLDKIVIDQNNNQAVSLVATLDEIECRGFSKIVIRESRVSKNNFSWETKIFLPTVNMSGIYTMHGKVLLLPLNGSGKFAIDIDELEALMHTTTQLYDKGGFTFYNVTKVTVDLKVKNAYSDFENLIKGNEEINRSTKELINENWRDFYDAISPLITKTIGETLQKILKEVFDILPANFLIEDIPTAEQLYGKKTK